MWTKVVLFYLTCATVTGAQLKCNYYPDTWQYADENLYLCVVQNYEIFTGSRISIDGVEGSHYSAWYDNDKVTSISIKKKSADSLPDNIGNYFKNLLGLSYTYSSLKELNQRDLKQFPKLKYLFMYNNEITTLPENLFQFNPRLKLISMSDNKITEIHPNVFDGLQNLQYLFLKANRCKVDLGYASTRSEVMSVIKQVQEGACSSTFQPIVQNDTQTTNEECESKLDNLNKNLTSVINEKKSLAMNFDALKTQRAEVQEMFLSNEKSCNETINELKVQNENLSNKLNEILSKYGTKEQLNEKIINLMDKLEELRGKQEHLLNSILEQSEKINKRKSEINDGQNQAD